MRHYSTPFILLLLSRFISEMITNSVWKPSNMVWSISFVAINIAILLWHPVLVLQYSKKQKIFTKYSAVFFYLVYLFTRIRYFDFYSYKCFVSESIVWLLFIFTAELSSHNSIVRYTIQTWIINLVKLLCLMGIVQITVFILSTKTYNFLHILDERPVTGIFAHPNLFAVIVFPFTFYFLNNRLYQWAIIVLFTCICTGARSPIVALLCMLLLVVKSIMRQKVNWVDIGISLLITLLVYFFIIIQAINSVYDPAATVERLTMNSMHWRVWLWSNFIGFTDIITLLFGKGLGAADTLTRELTTITFVPHNDYIRLYYDTGIVGLVLFVNLIIFVIYSIKKALTRSNVFILFAYLLIICFYITDNFIYYTHSIFSYMIIASHLSNTTSKNNHECVISK